MKKISLHEDDCVSLYLDGLNLLECADSDLQRVSLYEHAQLGKVLVINKEIQHVENWNPFYHEALVHIPMMFIKEPRNALILGGGDLFAANEILKYKSIKRITLCDYDPNVLNLMEKHYPFAKKIVADPRLNIVYKDAKIFLNETKEQYDLIVDDCFDLINGFETKQIFNVLKGKLSDIGVCSSLIYRHIFERYTVHETQKRLISQTNTVLSLVTVPEYPGVLHLLTIWGNSPVLDQNLEKSINISHDDIEFRKKCRLFNSDFVKFYLYISPFLKEYLGTTTNV